MIIRQAIILCGGRGTRLGPLTARTPKPLLPICQRPFLEILIEEIARQGVQEILLLAAYKCEQIRNFAFGLPERLGLPVSVKVLEEPGQAGTAGAIWNARAELASEFFLLNGDSWQDMLLSDLTESFSRRPEIVGAMAIRQVEDAGRFGSITRTGQKIIGFREKPSDSGAAEINAGVYAFRKSLIPHLSPRQSLENEVLPKLAENGQLVGLPVEGFFIDIGLPETLEKAQDLVPAALHRPAVFFDRDGVLNQDYGHVGTPERFEWMAGAREAVRFVNCSGAYAFVVTNQAGIGKGYYTEADYFRVDQFMRKGLSQIGAHIDDARYCPMHPEAVIARFRGTSARRKPAPGMLLELMERWPVDRANSIMIGDKNSDLEAAKAAGIRPVHFTGGNLETTLRLHFKSREAQSAA